MIKKIDMHIHVRTGEIPNYIGKNTTYANPGQIAEMYAMLGIERGVILPSCNPEYSIDIQSHVNVMDIVEKNPGLFSWFCNIDPRMGWNSPETDLSDFINFYKRLGAKGVGEICANLYFDVPLVENLFYHCQKTKMPVLFHVAPGTYGYYGLIDEVGLPRLEKELAKYPDLMFLGHSQPFWAEISTDADVVNRNTYPSGKVTAGRVVELMHKYPNLCGDLSANSGYNAVSRDPEFGYAFIEEFQDRLYFGTDICSPEDDRKLSFWLDDAVETGKISQEAYLKVCRENALKLLA